MRKIINILCMARRVVLPLSEAILIIALLTLTINTPDLRAKVTAKTLSQAATEAAGSSVDADLPGCLMAPEHTTISIPKVGFRWAEGEAFEGPCDSVADSMWVRQSAGDYDLFVATDGPGGSGRFWHITIGLADTGAARPARGVCIMTWTVGWRTLRQWDRAPLSWLEDRDGDGKPEVIIWDSFPLHEEATMAEYGLTAWVYRVSADGLLTLDWTLSRAMALQIAAAYGTPPDDDSAHPDKMRENIAAHLELFARGKCHQPKESE